MPTQNIYSLVDTWNAGGTTFTGIGLNVTDTASAAGSLLMDLQVGGTSRFSVAKTGALNTASTIVSASQVTATNFFLSQNGSAVYWSDLFLTRRAAANLRLGAADAAAPVAQTLSVQSGTAGASALSCSISGTTLTVGGAVTGTIAIGHAVTGTGVSAGTVITAGSGTTWTVNNSQTVSSTTMYFNSVGQNLTITGSQGSGPSAGGSIVFQVAPAGSAGTTAQNALVSTWQITGAGHLTLATDNTYDIGASGANRPRDVYVARNIRSGQNIYASGYLFLGADASTIISPSIGVIRIGNNVDNDFNRLQFGGTTSSFPAIKRSSTTLQARLADDSAFASVQGKLTTETAYTAGAPTATGYLILYDSTGTAYRVPAVLN